MSDCISPSELPVVAHSGDSPTRARSMNEERIGGVSVTGSRLNNSANSNQSLHVNIVPYQQSIRSAESIDSPRRVEHPSHTYSRLMLSAGRGFAVWDPRPPKWLPTEYICEGVRIGDVGIIHADGFFDYLFNICHREDHPINQGRVPDNFKPIQLSNEEAIINEVLNGYVYEAAGSVQVLESPRNTGKFSFNTTCGEGAILVLPEQTQRRELVSLRRFRQYAGENASYWYRFATERLGRDVVNGALYLITGWEKTSIGGTASFKPHSPQFGLSFSDTRWGDVGLARHRNWPNNEDGSSNPLSLNQCIFLKGFKVTLGEGFWNEIMGTVMVDDFTKVAVEDFITQSAVQSNIDSFTSGSLSKLWKLLPKYLKTTHRHERTGGALQVQLDSMAASKPVESFHPSNCSNWYLLSKFPEAKVAVTHDNEWAPFIDLEIIPEASDSQLEILFFDPVCRNGVAHLKSRDIATHPTRTHINDFEIDPLILIKAAAEGHKVLVSFLLRHGNVDVNARDFSGSTALISAASWGHEEVVRHLLGHPNIQVNATDKKGLTALRAAVLNDRRAIVGLLLSLPETDLGWEEKDGSTSLLRFAASGSTAILTLLLSRPDVSLTQFHLRIALLYAVSRTSCSVNDRTENVALLLKQPRICVNGLYEDGLTALMKAAALGVPPCVETLLKHPGIEINETSRNGSTALFHAAVYGHPSIIQLLLQRNNIDINKQNNQGHTALSRAILEVSEISKEKQGCYVGVYHCIQLLLMRKNVEVNTQDKNGHTPLYYARLGSEKQGRLGDFPRRVYLISSLEAKGARISVEEDNDFRSWQGSGMRVNL